MDENFSNVIFEFGTTVVVNCFTLGFSFLSGITPFIIDDRLQLFSEMTGVPFSTLAFFCNEFVHELT